MSASRSERVDTTLASAGTGKTALLVGRIARAVAAGLEPERVLATTFTRKAAADLAGRTRDHLVAGGRPEMAVRLAGARIGTVNAICGRLCQEFAFDLGLSPAAEVVDEEAARAAFLTAAADAISRAAPALNALADRLGLAERQVDWRDQVHGIVGLARAAGIDADALTTSADRSTSGLLDLLPPGTDAAEDLDAGLREAVATAMDGLAGWTPRASSRRAIEALQTANAILSRDEALPWPMWARLSKPAAAKADMRILGGPARAASAHPRHPRLREDLDRFVRLTFACAAESLESFQRFKRARGLIDFGDQETFALRALDDPANLERLRERIGEVFVDELQDASPVQVALFGALARVAPGLWVGDPKQCIYGFRGTDATLTLAAARGAPAETGGETGLLSTSWRSRPGICDFVDACFVPAFAALGLGRSETAFSDRGRGDSGTLEPPLSVWHLGGKGKREHADCVAAGVAAALADSAAWPVAIDGGRRGLRAGDVAVLCRGNDDVEAVAAALTRLGVPVAVDMGRLFDTIEGQLARAALRWVADRGDRLALAELARLAAAPDRPSAWLDALGEDDPIGALAREVPFAAALEAIRERLPRSTVSEVVDAVLVSGRLIETVCGWGGTADRIQALEAVRSLAADYEEACRRSRTSATLGGFAQWAADRDPPRPRSGGGDAVTILTYHRSKGLELPVVVCCQIDEAARAFLFQPVVEVDGEVDWRDPLARRWIRAWPWPYGRQARDVHLDAAAAESDVGRRAARRAHAEAVRLLYVGLTRARDHLVLASPSSREPSWLRTLDTDENAHVRLPEPGEEAIQVGDTAHPARSRLVVPAPPRAEAAPSPIFASTTLGRGRFRPLRQNPSSAVPAGARIVGRHDLGGRIPLRGSPDMRLFGQAIHGFLAADRVGAFAARRAMAENVLRRWGVVDHVEPADVVRVADRLRDWLDRRFPGARLRREASVCAVLGTRTVVGRIDLLVEGSDWFALVDHKTFPGGPRLREARAKAHAAQLDLYATAVRTVTGAACRGTFVHLPVVGAIVEVETPAAPG